MERKDEIEELLEALRRRQGLPSTSSESEALLRAAIGSTSPSRGHASLSEAMASQPPRQAGFRTFLPGFGAALPSGPQIGSFLDRSALADSSNAQLLIAQYRRQQQANELLQANLLRQEQIRLLMSQQYLLDPFAVPSARLGTLPQHQHLSQLPLSSRVDSSSLYALPDLSMVPSSLSSDNRAVASFPAAAFQNESKVDEPFREGKSETPVVNSQETFPSKLYRLLHEVEANGQDEIVSFTPSGRAFAIHNPTSFMDEIAPRYFKTRSFSSFKRQLYLYSFCRVVEGNIVDAFAHEDFVRDQPARLVNVKRQSSRRSGGAKKDHTEIPSLEFKR